MDLAQLITAYGYLAVFVGTLIEGETVVILAGLAAQRGYLDVFWVIGTAALGSLISYQVLFQIGRRVGPRILSNVPNSAAAAKRVRGLAERYPALVIIGIHFLYGVRVPGLFVIGMSGVGGWRFFWLNALGCLVWSIVVTTAGYLFGNIITAALGDLPDYDLYLFGGLILVAAVVALALRIRRRPIRPQ